MRGCLLSDAERAQVCEEIWLGLGPPSSGEYSRAFVFEFAVLPHDETVSQPITPSRWTTYRFLALKEGLHDVENRNIYCHRASYPLGWLFVSASPSVA
jgi:hypothetical protein